MVTILLNPQHATLWAHCNAQRGDPQGYARRQAERAIAKAAKAGGAWELTRSGEIVADSQANVDKALGMLGLDLRHNVFSMRTTVSEDGREHYLDDASAHHMRFTIEKRFGFRPTKEFFFDYIEEIARRNSHHPVLDYLDGLAWDGVPRLDTWLFDYAGIRGKDADDERSKYYRAVGRLILVAAVRRVRDPGCKFDEIVIFTSNVQGMEKSSALEILAVRPEWFTDSVSLRARDKEAIEQLQGKWIIEVPELVGKTEAAVEHIKSFLSRNTDRARLAYGRLTTEARRQCVFFSTTNEQVFLVDSTGNRRFWPVFEAKFDTEKLKQDVDQLWAEAAAAEAGGESIRLDKSLWAAAAEAQEEARVQDSWIEDLADELGDMKGMIRASSVWKILGVKPAAKKPGDDKRMGSAMRELGWERKLKRFGLPVPLWTYQKGSEGERQLEIHVIRNVLDGTLEVVPEKPADDQPPRKDDNQPLLIDNDDDIPF
jgi:hypothetical protein